MGIGYIIAGIIILANPNVNIIDILPDFIGCALIMKGISKTRYVNLSFEESYCKFRNLFFIELLKIPALLIYKEINQKNVIVFGEGSAVSGSSLAKDYTSILIVTCIFAIAEVIISISAFRNLFDGLSVSSYDMEKESYSSFSKVRNFTLAYMIIKPAMYVLPELSALSTGNSGYVTGNGITALVEYRDIFIIISFILTLIVGIIWAIKTISYFRSVKKDGEFLSYLERGGSASGEIVYIRRIRFILVLMLCAFLFSFAFRIDGIDYIPGFISAGLFLSVIFFYSKTEKISLSRKIFAYSSSALCFLSSVAFWVYSFYVERKYFNGEEYLGYGETMKLELENSFEAIDDFTVQMIFAILYALSLSAVLITVYLIISDISKKLIKPVNEEEALEIDRKDYKAKKNKVKAMNSILLVIGIVSALSIAFLTYASIYLPVYWTVDLVIRIIYVSLAALFIPILMKEASSI